MCVVMDGRLHARRHAPEQKRPVTHCASPRDSGKEERSLMNVRWGLVVGLARQIAETYALGKRPEDAIVQRLVRGVPEFQDGLVGLAGLEAAARTRRRG